MIKTIGEAAEELNSRYRSFVEKGEFLGKGAKGRFFVAQMKDLFDKFGFYLGYESFSAFKKDLQFCRKNIKMKKNNFFLLTSLPDILEMKNEETNFFPSEGNNYFTDWQIREYGLNPDSY